MYATDLTASCAPVESLPVGAQKSDLVDWAIDLKADYRDICARHEALVKVIQKK